MNSIVLEVLFFVLSMAGVFLGILGLPGNFIPVIVAFIALLFGDGHAFTWGWFAVFFLIAVSGEVVDQVTGILGAKKFGASRPGMVGALIGGIVGGILGTMVFPVVGSIIGVFVGCFSLTFLFEYLISERSTEESNKAGLGAVFGKAIAVAYKLIAGFVLLILMAWRFWIY